MGYRWIVLITAIAFAQIAWGAAFWSAPSPLHALAVIVAGISAAAILNFPQLGAFLLAMLLIGQWPRNIVRYLGILTYASALAWLVIRKHSLFPKNIILWLAIFYLFIASLSLINPKTQVELLSQILALVGNCALVWLGAALMFKRDYILVTIRLLVLAGIVTAIIGLVQYKTHFVWVASTTHQALDVDRDAHKGKTAFDLQQWRGEFRVDSITGTPDYLPLYMQCLTPFVSFWIVRNKRIGPKIAGLIILALFAVVHLLSFTRGALLTTAAVVLLLAWTIDRKRLLAYGPVLALAAVMAMLSWGPWRDRLSSIINFTSPEAGDHINTGDWRLKTIPVAFEMIGERLLLGVGRGQQRWNWPEHTIGDLIPDPKLAVPLPLHNDYLLVTVELGICGLIALLLLLGTTVRKLHELSAYFTATGDQELADVSRGLFIAIIGIVLAMPMYPLVENFRYLWLFFGMTAGLLRFREESLAVNSLPVNSV